MEKLVFVLWGDGTPEAGDVLRADLLERVVPRLQQAGGCAITVCVHDAAAAQAPSPVPVPPGEQPRDWPDGARSPGVLTVSLVHRPDGLDYQTWIERWLGITAMLESVTACLDLSRLRNVTMSEYLLTGM
jgi:hypothetical protein